MTSIYLSADNPRWIPKTEADLQAAIDDGLFEESHHLDLKKAPSSKGDNRELARDLVSFAVDGGTLIIGVQENKDSQTFELAPQPLNGLPEKIESVARSIPDPPLSVITDILKSRAGEGTGYVIVHIPASPVAPHMVDNKYFGRGDKAKYQMGDAEVVAPRKTAERRSGHPRPAAEAHGRRPAERGRRPVPPLPRRAAHGRPPGHVPAHHRSGGLEPARGHANQAGPGVPGPADGTRPAGVQSRSG